MVQKLECRLNGSMDWETLCEWVVDDAPYDADGWLDYFKDRVGSGVAPMPDGSGAVALDRVWCVRKAQ